ncbi:MAG: hypothetical protein OQK24_15050 [Magnetovibrio sp.]|nr:hypothetical protein [Magnetovibrio sp.]
MTRQHELEMTRDRLRQWGSWLQNTQGVFVGGSISQYEERMSVAEGLVLMGEDEVAERIERILCRIKLQHPKLYRVLWWWYYANAPWHEIADASRSSEKTVKTLRREGEIAVAAYWDAGYGENDTGESLKKSA